MQILIALCSNVLETMTGGFWRSFGVSSHMVEAQVYDTCAQTYGKTRVC